MTAVTHLTTPVAIHVACAVGALVLGPIALTARKGTTLHRWSGYTWVTLMLGAALSSLFLFEYQLPNVLGYGPIHLLTLVTFIGVGAGLWTIIQRKVHLHKRIMWRTYLGGCVGAGLFALMPGRFLGDLVWRQGLGWV